MILFAYALAYWPSTNQPQNKAAFASPGGTARSARCCLFHERTRNHSIVWLALCGALLTMLILNAIVR